MKKIKIITYVITICILIFISLFIIDYTHEYELLIKSSLVDEKSPDRILKVYENGNEIKFKRIEYTDGTFLCNYDVPAVSYLDIKDEEELVVIVKYNKEVIAKLQNIN